MDLCSAESTNLNKHKGRVFIDRDGDSFMSIITYLRTGKIPIFNAKMDEVKFNDEMEFWNIPFETTRGNDLIEEQSFDPEW